MKITIDDYMIKDLIESSDDFIVYRARVLIEKAIMNDILKIFTEYHIPLRSYENDYSLMATAVTSVVDAAIDEYLKVGLDQEEN